MAKHIAHFRLFDDIIFRPMALLYAERFLPAPHMADLPPTTYVVLNQ